MARTVALLATVAIAAASSCDSPFVVGADGVLRDTCGRQRYFRGLNSVWKSFPYYVDPNVFQGGGRSLSPQDRLLWRSLGFNAVRLGVLWEGTVPTARGVVNETYLDTMVNISAALYKDAGIYTLVDAHQDLFSPLFCADGAPPWAAQEYAQGSSPFPEPVAPNGTGCGLPSWAEYYPTAAVSRAFQTLYTTETGMTDYGDFWSSVVAAYARNPTANAGILGLELINEPWAGDIYADPLLLLPGVADKANLQPFYFNISARIRAAETSAGVPHRVIYSEPVTWDNFVNAGFDALPGASEGLSGLSYHFYPLPDVVGALWQVEARANDSHRLGAVGFLTEFDVNLVAPVSLPYTELDLRATLDACDDVGHGYLGWTWDGFWNGTVLIEGAAREMSRPFPFAIAGTKSTWRFNATGAAGGGPAYSLAYQHDAAIGAQAPTTIFLSTSFWFPADSVQVAVTSTPPGQVTWRLEQANGTTTTMAAAAAPLEEEGAAAPCPPPYAFALLYVETAQGATGVSAVEVTVTA